jgi:2'-5' RNA ligase
MAKGRYFFALWPEPKVCRQLAGRARACDNAGRLHDPQDLHMTLVYLGELADGQMRCVEETADTITGQAFRLQIDGLGYWQRPRILWAAPGETPGALSQLVFDLQQGLRACGFKPERRCFKPHVTLYRKSAVIEPRKIAPAIEWPVSGFALAVSGLSKPGESRYRILRRWPLAGEA